MTPEQLWNDHTFRTLLNDLFKARKDAAMGPMRLQVLLGYIDPRKTQAPQAHVPETSAGPHPGPKTQPYAGPNPFEQPLTDEQKIKPDLEATQAEAASSIERMIAKIKQKGETTSEHQFQVWFTADEAQAVQEIEHYLERFKVPYRLVADKFGIEKSFNPQRGAWILNFARVG